jgi:NAD(P)-dependent dehydrogenase (short-subunit alcohol dehydrogenase family)
MVRLAHKVALVTGAGSGIGRESALRMAADGAAVMCADIDGAATANTANIIIQQGGRAAAMTLDVTEESAVKAAIAETVASLGGLHILFNNAGIGGEQGWDRIISVNLTGVYFGLLHGGAYMAEQGGGAIINTASIAGLVGLVGMPVADQPPPTGPLPGAGAYIAAKHGVVGLTRQYALMYARWGVRVNAIAPGYIETPMTAGFRAIPAGVEFLKSLHPMGRLGLPEEIAAAAAFLASDDASFITGVVLPVDGGYTAR